MESLVKLEVSGYFERYTGDFNSLKPVTAHLIDYHYSLDSNVRPVKLVQLVEEWWRDSTCTKTKKEYIDVFMFIHQFLSEAIDSNELVTRLLSLKALVTESLPQSLNVPTFTKPWSLKELLLDGCDGTKGISNPNELYTLVTKNYKDVHIESFKANFYIFMILQGRPFLSMLKDVANEMNGASAVYMVYAFLRERLLFELEEIIPYTEERAFFKGLEYFTVKHGLSAVFDLFNMTPLSCPLVLSRLLRKTDPYSQNSLRVFKFFGSMQPILLEEPAEFEKQLLHCPESLAPVFHISLLKSEKGQALVKAILNGDFKYRFAQLRMSQITMRMFGHGLDGLEGLPHEEAFDLLTDGKTCFRVVTAVGQSALLGFIIARKEGVPAWTLKIAEYFMDPKSDELGFNEKLDLAVQLFKDDVEKLLNHNLSSVDEFNDCRFLDVPMIIKSLMNKELRRPLLQRLPWFKAQQDIDGHNKDLKRALVFWWDFCRFHFRKAYFSLTD